MGQLFEEDAGILAAALKVTISKLPLSMLFPISKGDMEVHTRKSIVCAAVFEGLFEQAMNYPIGYNMENKSEGRMGGFNKALSRRQFP